ncbi:pantoate--beta-alanine ligase [Dipodascopsis uninucleata]
MNNIADIKQSTHVIKTIPELRAWRRSKLLQGKSVGFVPTMGALHDGHLSLMKSSMRTTDASIVSIFVNPSQFSPSEDLESYPRTFENDLAAITDLGVDVVFVPSVDEMYPSGITTQLSKQTGAFVEVKGVSEQLEGSIRPHFFRGVATVVTKLLNIVQPERAFFGQKDIQQTVVVKRLVKDLHIDTVIHVVPTVREKNGLAMSSRNWYLSEKVRADASVINAALEAATEKYRSGITTSSELIDLIRNTIATKFNPEDIEYISVSDPISLDDIDSIQPLKGAIISLAIRVPNRFGGSTRLIDNTLL